MGAYFLVILQENASNESAEFHILIDLVDFIKKSEGSVEKAIII